MKQILAWRPANPVNFTASASLVALAIGCGMERISLAFIVPSSVILGVMIYWRAREVRKDHDS